ncbi:hypothetical protein KR009_006700 [Drosophila setifemur]|nr:hypothetical protein KR009_006700 [Drosophila setifemur]
MPFIQTQPQSQHLPPAPTTPQAQQPQRSPIGRTYAKSMPVTPIQPQSPLEETPSYELYEHQAHAHALAHASAHSDALSRFDDEDEENEEEEDTSSLAMIAPPPLYDTPRSGNSVMSPPLQPPRRFRFNNRELFSESPDGGRTTPTTSSAITPTKLSAAAAAMFAAPQVATQLNRKWAHLQRRRRRRNSSSGDSKELDQLVLQSVDWDENDMY